MAKFSDLKELVKKKGYGSTQYNNVNTEIVYLSTGIKAIFFEDREKEQEMVNAIGCFQKGDFGSAADYGKESRPGHEYGRYELAAFEETDEDTGVWVHRTEKAIKVYFKFER